jgi:hypothetical protein
MRARRLCSLRQENEVSAQMSGKPYSLEVALVVVVDLAPRFLRLYSNAGLFRAPRGLPQLRI